MLNLDCTFRGTFTTPRIHQHIQTIIHSFIHPNIHPSVHLFTIYPTFIICPSITHSHKRVVIHIGPHI